MSNTHKLFILCPGQGAQHVGMGRSWHANSPAARAVFEQADDILGLPLSRLCFEGPAEELNPTDIAQAAIYTTSVACYRGLVEQGEVNPDTIGATAGLSLGEFTALHLAGAFSFEDGLRLVRLRGEAMQEAANAVPSSMVAITGDANEEVIEELCRRVLKKRRQRGAEGGVLVPANYNSSMQVVVSGCAASCEEAVAVANEMGLKPTPLTVAGAFHSPIMQPAADRLAAALEGVPWHTPRVPVLSNVTGELHEITNLDRIKQSLVEQLTRPVRWSQSMAFATNGMTSDAAEQWDFIELAPGKVLSGLMRKINRQTKVRNLAEAVSGG